MRSRTAWRLGIGMLTILWGFASVEMARGELETAETIGLAESDLLEEDPAGPIEIVDELTEPAVQERAAAKRGGGAFEPNLFSFAHIGYNRINAYLLAYLSTVIYSDNFECVERREKAPQCGEKGERYETLDRLTGSGFANAFEREFGYLFHPNAQFEFQGLGQQKGYNPETLIITTPSAQFVVFRGTDRHAAAPRGSFDYQWGEWLRTDFDFAKEAALDERGNKVALGQVHSGFWSSITETQQADWVSDRLQQDDPGSRKKLWITGHSLGGAQAQAFAAYSLARGRKPQGVYVYASPHLGDKQFSDWMEKQLAARLQRFDFYRDPVTAFPWYTMGYDRAGVRNYYDSLSSSIARDVAERPLADLKDFGRAAGILVAGVPGAVLAGRSVVSEFCLHHPHWYLAAAYNQLSSTEREKVPARLPLPTTSWDGCSDAGMVARAKANETEQAQQAADAVANAAQAALEDFGWLVTNVFNQSEGDSIATATYRIELAANALAIDVDDDCSPREKNGCGIRLDGTADKYRIEKAGLAAGYFIKTKINNAGKRLEVQLEQRQVEGGRVQSWDEWVPEAGHGRWTLHKVGANGFVIRNSLSKKVLAANCLSKGCYVRQKDAVSGSKYQTWRLVKQ